MALHSDQATRWNDLFNFLSLSNQDLLEYQARVYATSLRGYHSIPLFLNHFRDRCCHTIFQRGGGR